MCNFFKNFFKKKGGNFNNIPGDSWNRMRDNIWQPGERDELIKEIFKDSNIESIEYHNKWRKENGIIKSG